MSDIFISYAREDQRWAETLAHSLVEHGWSVWWDRSIPPGKSFDQVIEEALDSAKCLIVLWSTASVVSDWVKAEAAEGLRRGIIVPVLIEDVKIPLEFRRIQSARLWEWSPSAPNPDFEALLRSVAEYIGQGAASGAQEHAMAVRSIGSDTGATTLPSPGAEQKTNTWAASLVAVNDTSRTFKVKLTHLTHTVQCEVRQTLGYPRFLVKVDGVAVGDKRLVLSATTSLSLKFKLADKDKLYDSTLQIRAGLLEKTSAIFSYASIAYCQLAVSERILYAEGEFDTHQTTIE